MLMPDQTVTASWKRFTDRVKRLWEKPTEGHCTGIAPTADPQRRDTAPRPAEAPGGLRNSGR